jgi:hypothetical protein
MYGSVASQVSGETTSQEVLAMGLRPSGLAVGLLLFMVVPVGAQDDPSMAAEQTARQKQTVDILRNVGVAMMSWLADAVSGDVQVPERGEETRQIQFQRFEEDSVASYSVLSHEALAALLVPSYITKLPETDGWGHPLEFALNENVLGSNVLAIRSPGRDGLYGAGPHLVGGFDSTDFDEDIVWADGYFVRWPIAAP